MDNKNLNNDKENLLQKQEELTHRLVEADVAYYKLSNPVMDDIEYDKLYNELLDLEAKTGKVLDNSPTKNVEPTLNDINILEQNNDLEIVTKLTKVTHTKPMLSLQKTKSVDELVAFSNNHEVVMSWKLDGLTAILTYENGILAQAATRGNGNTGENITHTAKTFQNLPKEIPYKDTLIIRGEALITFSKFEEINQQLELKDKETYKNPRNLCSGSVRQLDSNVSKERDIQFYAFDVIESAKTFTTKTEMFDWLSSLGFSVVANTKVTGDKIAETVNKFKDDLTTIDFATDGLVLSYNDLEYSNSLGETAKFPRHSMAFKWADEIHETSLIDVLWNTSRTGVINPIAIFEPVDIEGTTVERASLHNVSIFEELELGIGDTISVYKANMIIPQVYENLTKSNTLLVPTTCSTCKGDAKVVMLVDSKTLHCTNDNCSAKLLFRLSHFVSKNAMNIEGLSEKTLEKFINLGLITSFADIYTLDKHKDLIISQDGFGTKKYDNIIQSIEDSKTTGLNNLIYALGVSNVGVATAKVMTKTLNINDIDALFNLNFDDLVQIEGFGEKTSKEVIDFFNNEENKTLLRTLSNYITITNTKEDESDKLSGLVFVITGTLNEFGSRKDLQQLIEKNGGKVTSSVTSKTNYLINNDTTSTSSKNKKAKELDVAIINENMFLDILNG